MLKIKGLVIICFILCLIGCNHELTHLTCSYCNSRIFAHQLNHGGLSTRYATESQTRDGKHYHPWCIKIKEDADGKAN